MAYAHARGVIHRDLKPSNIMVGSFGEVQVMDWGLAKVLPQGGIADEARAQPAHETVIMTVRTGSAGSGSESQAGSVLGTPSCMAPEQPRGEIDRIDERSDVFGLGAILCEILTGQPPFAAASREETRAQAARGDLTDALDLLQTCRADAELIGLARSCIRPERDRRPRNAGEVARRISGYMAGVQERLKAAELARVEMQARAEEETKRRVLADELAREAEARADEARRRVAVERSRRRRTVALAASVLVTAGLTLGGWSYLVRQRTARLMATTQVVTEALAEAERLRGQAQSAAIGDLTKWSEALAAARHARALLAEGEADEALHRRVAAVLADFGREHAAAETQAAEVERDRKLLAELETIRGNRGEHWDQKQTDIDYAAAFRAFGIDPDKLDPEEAGKQIAGRSQPLELASYLDDWAVQRRAARGEKDEASWRRLLAAARAADPDPWRAALRDQIGRGDLEALRRLSANEKDFGAQSPPSLVLLAGALKGRGDRALAEQVLRRAWQIKPDDFWVNEEFGTLKWTGSSFDTPDEAVRYLSAAVAIRPCSSVAHSNLGVGLCKQRRLDEAVSEFRTAIRLKPDNADAHNNFGLVLRDQGKLNEAITEFRSASRLKPDHVSAHISLGAILCDVRHDYDGGIAEFRAAIRLEADNAVAHNNLGYALWGQGRVDEAIAEHRESIRLKPDYPEAHNNLGIALSGRADPEEIAEYRESVRLNPDYSEAHNNLGAALIAQGKLNEAIAECRKALRLTPDFFLAHSNLGKALIAQGKLEEGAREYREAIWLKPDCPEAHCGLGELLQRERHFAEALAEFKRGHEVGLKNPNWRYPSAQWVRNAERLVELDGKLPAILNGKAKPANAAESLGFAQSCYYRKIHGSSARLWTEALQAEPKLADDMQDQNRYDAACAAALAGSGQGKDDPPLDEPTKARWRKQSLDWLKADLAAWLRVLQTGPPELRQSIPQTLQHWKSDPDLAGLRDSDALKRLPEAEQKACRALWAEVDALLVKAQGDKKR